MSDPCFNWSGCVGNHGYGVTYRNGKKALAHRAAWADAYGLKQEDCVLHKCDNRLCIKLSHLFLGTRADNNNDRHKKGRTKKCVDQAKGERQHLSKLTAEKVLELRARAHIPHRRLAAEYGVAQPTISAAIRGATWKHL